MITQVIDVRDNLIGTSITLYGNILILHYMLIYVIINIRTVYEYKLIINVSVPRYIIDVSITFNYNMIITYKYL